MFLNKKDVLEIVDSAEDRLAEKIDRESEIIYDYIRGMLAQLGDLLETHRKSTKEEMLEYTNGLSKQIEILADQVGDAQEEIININSDMLTQSAYESSRLHESVDQDYEARLKAEIDRLKEEEIALLEQNATLEKTIEDLKAQLAKKDEYLNKLLEINKDKDNAVWEIAGSLSAVTQGLFREDCIEFAAMKTYRGGWQYIYLNGKQVKDFALAENVCVNWSEGEPVTVNLDSCK